MTKGDQGTATILIVGDLHGHWTDADREFVEQGDQDLVMFVGDLGDENVGIVRDIADLEVPKAVILGNHDAWESFSQRSPTKSLRDSVEILGDDHVGYRRRELPFAGLTLLGGRPFTWGGDDLRSPEVYEHYYGVRTMRQSARRIEMLARDAEHDDVLILAHNGPLGLSTECHHIYGKDFGRRPGGDWGDRDLALAIERIRNQGKTIRAVIAGHMHDKLVNPRGGRRIRFVRHDGIPYLNPAVVPRIRSENGDAVRHYLQTTWRDGELLSVDELWVDAGGGVRIETPEILDSVAAQG